MKSIMGMDNILESKTWYHGSEDASSIIKNKKYERYYNKIFKRGYCG